LLGTPGVLEGKIKLENALPVAGFLTRSDNTDYGDHQHEYIRSGNLRVKPGAIDRVIATIKDETSSFLSSEPEILSFIAFQSLDEADTIITWERYTSQFAFDESMKKGRRYAELMEKIDSLVETEGMTGYRVAGGYLSRDVQ
jgi:quinol monooxygenase YgiN